MWLATKCGWFSIVRKQDGYYVRARSVKDLKILKKKVGLQNPIKQWAGTDYIARIILTKQELSKVGSFLFNDIDYSNFKDEIRHTPQQKDKMESYHNVWCDMFQYQSRRAVGGLKPQTTIDEPPIDLVDMDNQMDADFLFDLTIDCEVCLEEGKQVKGYGHLQDGRTIACERHMFKEQ